VRVGHLGDDLEAEPRPLRVGRDAGVEHPVAAVPGDSGAIVFDVEAVTVGEGADLDVDRFAGVSDRVGEQVLQSLPQPTPVGAEPEVVADNEVGGSGVDAVPAPPPAWRATPLRSRRWRTPVARG